MSVRISVIIPVYNGDRYITQTIDSVLNQTYQDFEIIVIDDGSKDNSRQTLERYGDRIRYVYQENSGVAEARNHGFQLAQGEFIAFLDQDDVLLENKLALQLQAFEEDPDVEIVHSGWRLVDSEGNFWSDIKPWKDAPELDLAGWLMRMPVLFSAMMFRRSALEKVGKFDARYKQACDVDLVQRLILRGGKTVWVKQITVLYRQHESNDSLNTITQAIESWKVREQFFDQPNLPEAARKVERDCRYYTLVWIGWRLYHTGRLAEMATYLEQAFLYRPGTWTETLMQWVDLFQRYEAEYGGKLDVNDLTQSSEWQTLMQNLYQRVDMQRSFR
jgi:glycosyltransferase involved in cell wall biosynthesis